jgi:hypothetical protein
MRLTGALGYKEITNIAVRVDRAVFVNVVSTVRSKISDWAIKLKKAGISGEGFSFSDPERHKAHEADVTINIGHIGYLTGNVGEISGKTRISSQTNVTTLDLGRVRELIVQLQELRGLPDGEAVAIRRQLALLNTELEKEVPEQNRIRTILKSIRNVAEGVVGNVIAIGIVQLIANLLGP